MRAKGLLIDRSIREHPDDTFVYKRGYDQRGNDVNEHVADYSVTDD